MKNLTFASCLSCVIERFIRLRSVTGSDYSGQALLLSYFDRFLAARNYNRTYITQEICDSYLLGIMHLAPRSQGNRMCVVRQLCRYIALDDPRCYIPEPLPRPSSKQTCRAYIFTRGEISALMQAALKLAPAGSLRPRTYWTLLGLLYSTGIRIGEAMALNLDNFFQEEMRLYIAKGKFRKARWIVLSESTCEALSIYLEHRLKKEPHSPESPLFINERRCRLCHPSVYATYLGLLRECGISRSEESGPRIHDLRHTFAVHRLLAWYREGGDVNALLPVLSTYMGHADITSTQIYLQPTSELKDEVSRRFHSHYINSLSGKGELS